MATDKKILVEREKFKLLVEKVLKLKEEIIYLENKIDKMMLDKASAGRSEGERLTATYNLGDSGISWRTDEVNQKYLKSKFGLI